NTSKITVIVTLALLAGAVVPPRAARAQLLGIDIDTTTLYRVSTSNAALTPIGNTGVGMGEIELSPGGVIYGVSVGGGPTLYTITPSPAAATPVGPLGLPFVFEGGLAFSPGGTAYGANGGTADNPQLFTLNLATGAASVVGTISGGSHDINGLA